MESLLRPWQVARSDQIDAAIRELILQLDPSTDLSAGLCDLPDDPFPEGR